MWFLRSAPEVTDMPMLFDLLTRLSAAMLPLAVAGIRWSLMVATSRLPARRSWSVIASSAALNDSRAPASVSTLSIASSSDAAVAGSTPALVAAPDTASTATWIGRASWTSRRNIGVDIRATWIQQVVATVGRGGLVPPADAG